jgi:hypothetical protein
MFKLNDNDPNYWHKWIANVGIVIIGWAVAMAMLGFF